jgi:hydroxymethylbilane synthase
MERLVLATRKSPLALVQAERVAAQLRARLGAEIDLLKIVTTGDRQAAWSLEQKGGKGLFTSELEQAVLRGEADVAVHSTKDLPGEMSEGLALAGYLPRDDPRDVLALRAGSARPGRIATGSPRRRMQAAMLFPEAAFCEIRGNVDTRLRKIADPGGADATLLAAAGLQRLGIDAWPGLEFRPLGFGEMVPAVGQGAIAVQCRAAESGRYAPILDRDTASAVALERAFQAALGAGCHTAFAAHATADRLYFFHEKTGIHVLALAPDDFGAPAGTAGRFLKKLGLAA